MNNTDIEKPKFIFLVDTREYISNSMIITNIITNPSKSGNGISFEKRADNDKSRPFDLYAHILEG